MGTFILLFTILTIIFLISFIKLINDFVVNQYYINCATENGTIGYPIQYCPICGEKLK